MSKQLVPRSERLKKGAAFLGQLWMNPENRCPNGWSIDPCNCQPRRKFCQARDLWVTLAIEDWMANLDTPNGRDMDDSPFGLGISMTASEWDATGLKMKVQHPDAAVGLMVLGSAPECVAGISYLGKMMDVPEALASTLRVLKTFARSKVHGTVHPEKVAVAVTDTFEAEPEAEVVANPDEAFE